MTADLEPTADHEPLTALEEAVAEGIERVLVALGPYRNLTTHTGAILALHPAAIALNHAGRRVFVDRSLDWVRRPTPETLERFVRAAVRWCQAGRRGSHGGSILLSHAFDDAEVKARYRRRFGDSVLKPGASVLYWKESMRVTNALTNRRTLDAVLATLPKVCFVVPVRNPVDCAKSNLSTKHWRMLADERRLEPVLDRIVEVYAWLWAVRAEHPERLLFLWEDEALEIKLRSLATLVGLDHDPAWAEDVRASLAIRKRQRAADEVALYRRYVLARADDGELRQRLLELVPGAR